MNLTVCINTCIDSSNIKTTTQTFGGGEGEQEFN